MKLHDAPACFTDSLQRPVGEFRRREVRLGVAGRNVRVPKAYAPLLKIIEASGWQFASARSIEGRNRRIGAFGDCRETLFDPGLRTLSGQV
jgi:hypothetical protein